MAKGTTRRALLGGAAAVTVIVAGGVVYRGVERGAFTTASGPAYAPWTTWFDAIKEGGPLAVVAGGILASNPHNTQPWIFRVSDDRIELYADRKKHLGTMDPFLREMHLGLGAALENMTLTAEAVGYEPSIEPAQGRLSLNADKTEAFLVAVMRLEQARKRQHPLFDAIPDRHTHRGPYDRAAGMSKAELEFLEGMSDGSSRMKVVLYTDGPQREEFDRLTYEGTEAIISDKEMGHDSHKWFRLTKDEIEEHRDGPSIDASGLPYHVRALAKWMPPLSEEETNGYWLATTKDVHLATAPVTGFIAVKDKLNIAETLSAGMLWQRMHLWATTQGLAMHPINQAPEMADRDDQLGKDRGWQRRIEALIGEGWHATFAFRVGRPKTEVYPAPRRPVDWVVKD